MDTFASKGIHNGDEVIAMIGGIPASVVYDYDTGKLWVNCLQTGEDLQIGEDLKRKLIKRNFNSVL